MTFRSTFLVSAALYAAIVLPQATPALAQAADITIRDRGSKSLPVSFAGLRGDGSREAQLFLQVLRADLDRSGWLRVVDNPNASARVEGFATGGGSLGANLRIIAPSGAATPWQQRAAGTPGAVRTMAHVAADEILLRITGHKGMASAPILFVGKDGSGSDIYSCDPDGGNFRRLTNDGKICLSPRWFANRSGFLYTAFLRNFGGVYRADFTPGGSLRRTTLAQFPGLNNGAVASPDGKLVALVLSYTGNVELYVMNLQSKRLTRLTKTPHANEASPAWSPDGKTIAYVSDAGRTPQIHIIHPGEREGRRLIHNLQESVAPDWAPDGRLAFCGKQRGGRYGIYVASSTGASSRVSPDDGANWEDPSWAPDGRHIVATRTAGGRRTLVILDSETGSKVELTAKPGESYLADWAK